MTFLGIFVCVSVCMFIGYIAGRVSSEAGKKLGDAFMAEVSANKVRAWCDQKFDTPQERIAVYIFCQHLLDEVKARIQR